MDLRELGLRCRKAMKSGSMVDIDICDGESFRQVLRDNGITDAEMDAIRQCKRSISEENHDLFFSGFVGLSVEAFKRQQERSDLPYKSSD